MSYKEDAIVRAHNSNKTSRTANIFVLNEIKDLPADLCNYLIEIAGRIKHAATATMPLTIDRPILGLFQQTSTRTRASLDVAAYELRAKFTYMDWRTTNFHLTLPEEEIKILSELYAMIFVRARDHSLLKRMSLASSIPFVNAMSSYEHPVQALSDFLTIKEFFQTDFHNLKLAYIGDANNVARSLTFLAETMRLSMVYSSPKQYRFREYVPAQYYEDPRDAVEGADIVYTDTWVSIGDETQRKERLEAFAAYQVNEALLARAPDHALIMHCLPAHLNEEISETVYTSPRAIHREQALNKQYIMQSLMVYAMHEYKQGR